MNEIHWAYTGRLAHRCGSYPGRYELRPLRAAAHRPDTRLAARRMVEVR
ncbi:MAG: hypothetical protein ABI406_05995 [Ktedonobacteraceae bacterium]